MASRHSTGVARLVRALYGLVDSPRLWYKRYEATLCGLGWESCPQTTGIYRKPSKECPNRWLRKSVYVDDNVATGPHLGELMSELEKIQAIHPGRFIETKNITDSQGVTWLHFDLLGADVYYAKEQRNLRITMSSYIRKLASKYGIEDGSFKPCRSPNFHENAIADPKATKVPDYPIRKVRGELQWISTSGRPDICVPISCLSKYTTEVPNRPIVNACRKVLKYLLTTADEGLEYSPSSEKAFEETYGKLLPADRPLPALNAFTDASYANCLRTLRSTSGSILYYHGTPVLWKTSRQGVRAYSTGEAEYIGCSDLIIITEQNDWFQFFEELPNEIVKPNNGVYPSSDKILWVDNTSAIAVAKSEEYKPKSRHYALRYLRVRDHAKDMVFVPTHLQKADALTKLECSVSQRRLLLHNVQDPVVEEGYSESESESAEDRTARITSTVLYSALLY